MAAIEINVSVPLLQPSVRRRGNHSCQAFACCIHRSPANSGGLASSQTLVRTAKYPPSCHKVFRDLQLAAGQQR